MAKLSGSRIAREVHNGKIIILTPKEKILFILLIANLNAIIPVDTILYSVWYDNLEVNIARLKTLLKNLRRKLPRGMIENSHGIGYKMNG